MKKSIKKLTLSALFLAIGIVLPFLTGQIQQIGNKLLPMHLPVFLCGLICGWQYGLAVGLIVPIMRSFLFGMPPMYPNAVAMMLELAVYGAVSGALYAHGTRQNIISLYASMLMAMLAGRFVWGIAEIILLGISGSFFTWEAFMTGAFINAVPGVILQLTVIPALMTALHKTGFLPIN